MTEEKLIIIFVYLFLTINTLLIIEKVYKKSLIKYQIINENKLD